MTVDAVMKVWIGILEAQNGWQLLALWSYNVLWFRYHTQYHKCFWNIIVYMHSFPFTNHQITTEHVKDWYQVLPNVAEKQACIMCLLNENVTE